MNVENNLVYYRQKRGISAIELAKEIGVSRQTILRDRKRNICAKHRDYPKISSCA